MSTMPRPVRAQHLSVPAGTPHSRRRVLAREAQRDRRAKPWRAEYPGRTGRHQ